MNEHARGVSTRCVLRSTLRRRRRRRARLRFASSREQVGDRLERLAVEVRTSSATIRLNGMSVSSKCIDSVRQRIRTVVVGMRVDVSAMVRQTRSLQSQLRLLATHTSASSPKTIDVEGSREFELPDLLLRFGSTSPTSRLIQPPTSSCWMHTLLLPLPFRLPPTPVRGVRHISKRCRLAAVTLHRSFHLAL